MAYKPILFNTEMVQAILDRRKTQTRRVMKILGESGEPDNPRVSLRPPFNKGDILWVRETWSTTEKCGLYPNWPTTGTHYMYKADDPDCEPAKQARWFPSIHMPKEAARIFLRVKNVRVEQLWDITVLDAINEGCGGTICNHEYANPTLGCTDCYNTGWLESPDAEFAQLWDTTIKPTDRDKYGWNANPWVWVIEFEKTEKPEGWCTA